MQGARNKSNTHFAAVYPPDMSNNSVALMMNEDIWWKENTAGNELTNPSMAKGVARMFMDALEAKYPQLVVVLSVFLLISSFIYNYHCQNITIDF